MPSFEELLNMPMSETKQPEVIPPGTYHCIVDGPPEAGESSQKKTPFRRYNLKIMQPMQDVDATKAAETQAVGKRVRVDFYITEDALIRYKQFLTDHLGITGMESGKTYKEAEAEAVGRQCLARIKHRIDGDRRFVDVESTARVS